VVWYGYGGFQWRPKVPVNVSFFADANLLVRLPTLACLAQFDLTQLLGKGDCLRSVRPVAGFESWDDT
jgi:hypothetical protein